MEAETPLVSVVLNTYNRPDLLRQSVASVLAQDYPNFEVIIVDDCSPDNTPEVVAGIVAQHPDRVRSLRLPENRGLAAARNAGIRAARGPLIAFQDDDDLWLPGKLTAQVEALRRHPECGLCYGKALEATPDGHPTHQVHGGSALGKTGDCFELMLRHHVIYSPCLLFSRQCVDTVGHMDETLRTAEDDDYYLRLTAHFRAAYVSEPIALVRQHQGRKTHGEWSDGRAVSCLLRVYTRLWEDLPARYEHVRGFVSGKCLQFWLGSRSRATDRSAPGETHASQTGPFPSRWLDYFEANNVLADAIVEDRVQAHPSASVRDSYLLASLEALGGRDLVAASQRSPRRRALLQCGLARQSLKRGNLRGGLHHTRRAVALSPCLAGRHILAPSPGLVFRAGWAAVVRRWAVAMIAVTPQQLEGGEAHGSTDE